MSLGLFALALGFRLGVLWLWPFDGLYGQDPYAYLGQAQALARGLLARDFFWPSGYPLVVAVAMLVLGPGARAAQTVNLLLGAGLAPLTYGLSRAVLPEAGNRAAAWAGLMVALAGQVVLSSLVIMADIPALFWALLGVWLLVRAWPPVPERQGIRAGTLLLVGVSLGLAVISRWLYALLALPLGAYALATARRAPRRYLTLPALGGLAVVAPQVWLSLNRPESLAHHWLLGWRPANAFGRAFSSVDGDYTYLLPVGVYNLQALFHPGYMLPILGLAALWGAWRLGRSRSWPALILLGGWFGVAYLFLAGIPYQNFRYGLQLYPPAAILAGAGIEWLAADPPGLVRGRTRSGAAAKRWSQGVRLVAAACLLGMVVWGLRSADRFISVHNGEKAIARQIEASLPPDATLLAFSLTLTLSHYTDLDVVELYHQDAASLERLTSGPEPLYLVLDPGNVARQWQGRPPALNYRWLQDHRTLTPVGEFPPYRLFRVDVTEGKQ